MKFRHILWFLLVLAAVIFITKVVHNKASTFKPSALDEEAVSLLVRRGPGEN
jgi:hypothetical protein